MRLECLSGRPPCPTPGLSVRLRYERREDKEEQTSGIYLPTPTIFSPFFLLYSARQTPSLWSHKWIVPARPNACRSRLTLSFFRLVPHHFLSEPSRKQTVSCCQHGQLLLKLQHRRRRRQAIMVWIFRDGEKNQEFKSEDANEELTIGNRKWRDVVVDTFKKMRTKWI